MADQGKHEPPMIAVSLEVKKGNAHISWPGPATPATFATNSPRLDRPRLLQGHQAAPRPTQLGHS